MFKSSFREGINVFIKFSNTQIFVTDGLIGLYLARYSNKIMFIKETRDKMFNMQGAGCPPEGSKTQHVSYNKSRLRSETSQ